MKLLTLLVLLWIPKHKVVDLINSSDIVYKKVAIAQSIHETGKFKSRISRYKHNHFGFKNNRGKYKSYTSDSLSVIDYQRWSNRYIKRHKITSERAFIRHLRKNYAKDKRYVNKITNIRKTL